MVECKYENKTAINGKEIELDKCDPVPACMPLKLHLQTAEEHLMEFTMAGSSGTEDTACLFDGDSQADCIPAVVGRTEVLEDGLKGAVGDTENKGGSPVRQNKKDELILQSDLTTDGYSNGSAQVKACISIAAKPTLSGLIDDSKLNKILLPVTPASVMQSNAQFLNKSRHFFNYLTEKSTNMMEKALIPQQLAVRCNTMLRTANNAYAAASRAKCAEKSIPTDGNTDLTAGIFSYQTANTNGLVSKTETSSEGTLGGNAQTNTGTDDQSALLPTNLSDTEPRQVDSCEIASQQCLISTDNLEVHEEKSEPAALTAERLDEFRQTIGKLSSDLHNSLTAQAILKEEYALANKERESMVMKFAVSEKRLIDMQRALELAEHKIQETTKENEVIRGKLAQAQGERTRMRNILEEKCREENDFQKEIEGLKEEVNLKGVKLKWMQDKLKVEMELRKESQQRLEKAVAKANEMKEECERVRRDTQETIREFQRFQESKTVTLDEQLKEQQAKLILERHVTEDKETSRLRLQREVETLESRQRALVEENNLLSLKIQDSEKNLLNCENNLGNLKMFADQRQKENADLRGRISELEVSKLRLQHQLQRLESCETEMVHLRRANTEMQADMDACRQREADMLDFTQKLTDKNVRLQSEYNAVEARTKRLEAEQGPLRERINELLARVRSLSQELAREQQKRTEECEILAKHLAEQTRLAENRARELEDSRGENAVLKRKHQASMKEMARELQYCRKRLSEASSPLLTAASPSASVAAHHDAPATVASSPAGGCLPLESSKSSTSGDFSTFTAADKQALIDRIVKLQEINVKRAEKLDFYEEHTRSLVEELQKKTKVIQNYVLREDLAAMGSNERDRNKAELAKHGGIMASVYNQRVSDDAMTLELSLEMNKKLQAVLEDALLKNITLKDNIDTLGEEIARLTMQNQHKSVANTN